MHSLLTFALTILRDIHTCFWLRYLKSGVSQLVPAVSVPPMGCVCGDLLPKK